MRTLPTALLLGASLVLAACGPDAVEETPEAAETPAEAAPAEATDDPDVVLRLLTHDSFDVSTEVLESFTSETGIEVEVHPQRGRRDDPQPGDPHQGLPAGGSAVRGGHHLPVPSPR